MSVALILVVIALVLAVVSLIPPVAHYPLLTVAVILLAIAELVRLY